MMSPSRRCACLLACLGLAGAITDEMQQVLNKHNIYRCMHNVPPLTWDDAIAADAQAWADNGKYEHSPKTERVVGGVQSGENLAWGNSLSGVAATKLWYAEVQYTEPYGTAHSLDDSTDPSQEIGHYTAMVWLSTTKLGCGKGKVPVFLGGSATFSQANESGTQADFLVCQYGPVGNIVGQFPAMVLAPTKTVDSCGGSSDDVPGGGDGLINAVESADGAGTDHTELPSACFPSTPLPTGGLCVFGFQCESKFCCPRRRVCVEGLSGTVSSSDLQVHEDIRPDIVNLIFNTTTTCEDPWANHSQCLQSRDGEPLSTWNQAMCGCKEEYMTRYEAGTWLLLNNYTGFTCEEGGNNPSGVAIAVASFAATTSVALKAGLAIAAATLFVSLSD